MSQAYFVKFFKGQKNNIPLFFIPCGGLLEVIFTHRAGFLTRLHWNILHLPEFGMDAV